MGGGGRVHCNKGCWGRQRINREPGLWASYVAVYDILAAARVFVSGFSGEVSQSGRNTKTYRGSNYTMLVV